MEQIIYIINFIQKSFIQVWPYLLITIPLAVWMNLSDFSKHVKSILSKSPWISIFLATVVGAFSPFCSCGVIPVISALLLGGVPLAPVLAFWIASPSMDPEIFFLSVSILGWKLAIWRLASTFIISLAAGTVTYYLVKSGYLSTYLRVSHKKKTSSFSLLNFSELIHITQRYVKLNSIIPAKVNKYEHMQFTGIGIAVSCCPEHTERLVVPEACGCSCSSEITKEISFREKMIRETLKAVWMITKFMGLAFLLNALINLYVPEVWIGKLLNQHGFISVIIAAALGVPVYTSNLTALPFIGGLLHLGLHPGAALAFLISGPLTTIPAMVAVYGITTKKVFGLYLGFAFFGALIFGIMYYFIG